MANNMTTDVHIRLMVTRGRKSKPFQHPQLSIFGSTVVIIAEHSKPDMSGHFRESGYIPCLITEAYP